MFSKLEIQSWVKAKIEFKYENEIDCLVAENRDLNKKRPLVFLGDSDFRYWRNEGLFNKQFLKFNAINLGFGGARFWEVLYYSTSLLKEAAPEIIFINCGDNDMAGLKEQGAHAIEICLRNLLGKLTGGDWKIKKIVCFAIHPAPKRDEQNLRNLQEDGNSVIKQVCCSFEEAVYDPFPFDFFLTNQFEGYFLEDGLHFNSNFYNFWFEHIYNHYLCNINKV